MLQNEAEEKTVNLSGNVVSKDTEEHLVWEELYEDAVWEVCFEVHRAIKLGYFFLDEHKRAKNCQNMKDDVRNEEEKTFLCPKCNEKKGSDMIAAHVATCGNGRRKAANQKWITDGGSFEEDDSDENDCEDSNDSDFGSNRKKPNRNKKAKANYMRNSKSKGNSVPKSSLNITWHDDMTLEEKKAFFDQKCGVVAKRSNKMCMKSSNCSQHSDDSRRAVRLHFLSWCPNLPHVVRQVGTVESDMSDHLMNGQLDVDTVDEGKVPFSFIDQSMHH